MTRLLLTWIGFTILQVGTPRIPGAAELRPGGESTRVVPQLEVLSNGAVAREGPRSDDLRGIHTPPFAPVEPARLSLTPLRGELPAQEPGLPGPASRPFLLPDARAPPA